MFDKVFDFVFSGFFNFAFSISFIILVLSLPFLMMNIKAISSGARTVKYFSRVKENFLLTRKELFLDYDYIEVPYKVSKK